MLNCWYNSRDELQEQDNVPKPISMQKQITSILIHTGFLARLHLSLDNLFHYCSMPARMYESMWNAQMRMRVNTWVSEKKMYGVWCSRDGFIGVVNTDVLENFSWLKWLMILVVAKKPNFWGSIVGIISNRDVICPSLHKPIITRCRCWWCSFKSRLNTVLILLL